MKINKTMINTSTNCVEGYAFDVYDENINLDDAKEAIINNILGFG